MSESSAIATSIVHMTGHDMGHISSIARRATKKKRNKGRPTVSKFPSFTKNAVSPIVSRRN
jgi:hypothetical protein